jgi:HPt (histidine-containing phosphotransfer) domain-containing protein
MFRTLARYITVDPSKPFDATAPTPVPSGATVELPSELSGIDLADGLGHLAGNRGAYRRLLVQFGTENRLMESLRSALEGGDRQAAVRAAHSLKSVAGNLGAKDLRLAAAEVEAALKAGSETPALLDGLADRFETVRRSIWEWAVRGADPVGPTLEAGELRGRLEELRALVADNDATAVERCEALMERASGECRARLRGVQEALAAYDFEGGLKRIEAMLGEGA